MNSFSFVPTSSPAPYPYAYGMPQVPPGVGDGTYIPSLEVDKLDANIAKLASHLVVCCNNLSSEARNKDFHVERARTESRMYYQDAVRLWQENQQLRQMLIDSGGVANHTMRSSASSPASSLSSATTSSVAQPTSFPVGVLATAVGAKGSLEVVAGCDEEDAQGQCDCNEEDEGECEDEGGEDGVGNHQVVGCDCRPACAVEDRGCDPVVVTSEMACQTEDDGGIWLSADELAALERVRLEVAQLSVEWAMELGSMDRNMADEHIRRLAREEALRRRVASLDAREQALAKSERNLKKRADGLESKNMRLENEAMELNQRMRESDARTLAVQLALDQKSARIEERSTEAERREEALNVREKGVAECESNLEKVRVMLEERAHKLFADEERLQAMRETSRMSMVVRVRCCDECADGSGGLRVMGTRKEWNGETDEDGCESVFTPEDCTEEVVGMLRILCTELSEMEVELRREYVRAQGMEETVLGLRSLNTNLMRRLKEFETRQAAQLAQFRTQLRAQQEKTEAASCVLQSAMTDFQTCIANREKKRLHNNKKCAIQSDKGNAAAGGCEENGEGESDADYDEAVDADDKMDEDCFQAIALGLKPEAMDEILDSKTTTRSGKFMASALCAVHVSRHTIVNHEWKPPLIPKETLIASHLTKPPCQFDARHFVTERLMRVHAGKMTEMRPLRKLDTAEMERVLINIWRMYEYMIYVIKQTSDTFHSMQNHLNHLLEECENAPTRLAACSTIRLSAVVRFLRNKIQSNETSDEEKVGLLQLHTLLMDFIKKFNASINHGDHQVMLKLISLGSDHERVRDFTHCLNRFIYESDVSVLDVPSL